MPVFDAAAIEGFEVEGYVMGRDIVPRAAALAMREEVLAQVEDNRTPSGWRDSMRLLHGALGADAWAQVRTPRLHAALDQLLGAGRWTLPQGFGSWPILFPGFSAPPWQALEMSWHVEGRTYEHWLDSPEIGVTMILLLSDIAPGDGGTAIALGSHHVVARILRGAREGMTQMQLTGAYLRACADFAVVEAQGCAGDMLFMHPFTVHATSLNIGEKVRVACNCRASLRERMRIVAAPGLALSPVERVVSAGAEPASVG